MRKYLFFFLLSSFFFSLAYTILRFTIIESPEFESTKIVFFFFPIERLQPLSTHILLLSATVFTTIC